MNTKKFSEAMGEIDQKYIEQAISYGVAPVSSSPTKYRLPLVLVAAVMAVFLMGAGVVAAVYGDSIQSWFSHYWEAVTGQKMSEEHTAVIEHLSQEIGISQTSGDITITVDSATVGDDNFFLLLRVDGVNFSDRYSYDFQMAEMETIPDPLQGGALAGCGIDYLGVDGDGSALLLLDYKYVSENDYVIDDHILQVMLSLRGLVRNAHTEKEKVLSEGEWYFSFTIDRSELPETILLSDTQVMARVLDKNEEVQVTLTNIELTNTGLRFQYEHEQGRMSFSEKIEVVLDNGNIIANGGGVGVPTKENEFMKLSYQWIVPINLDEVAYVKIGETKIPVVYPDKDM